MKQRILVMNKQQLVQTLRGTEWKTDKVDKAEDLKAGIYNIYLAVDADKNKTYNGLVVYADKDALYLKTETGFVKYSRDKLDLLPPIGSNVSINYENDKIRVNQVAAKVKRKLSI
ncbi:KfrB domain-containing protein [Nitrosomonas sp. Is37]|uniref:KfrB domain-containing protein n=1 Tax=Nitrosomonas sp. Is37 TaxID=3080535 RepID=UPI00294B1347|nr:KfrB domain-containing protein [Nitrosomonas sp. Is37]MDV6344802.1 KfrB domain-containing protein [Nitrosomonas sp. Is37]